MIASKSFSLASSRTSKSAFTLVEVLTVLVLLLILAAVALPAVRKLLSDQKVSRAARGMAAYMDVARNRAISEGRQVGVLIQRAGTDARGLAHSIQLRQLTDIPPYTGDASDAVALLLPNPAGGFRATFDPINSQLMALSASMVADPGVTGDTDDPNGPIRNGDLLELPGGRVVPFTFVFRAITEPDTTPVEIRFNLTETIVYGSPARFTNLFPTSNMTVPVTGRPLKYKIHRRPVVSSTAPLSLPRGVAIDLNYSGFGVSGNELAPDVTAPVFNANIAIIFGPDGKVVSVTDDSSGTAVLTPPLGQIFLCLADVDGIRPDNLFARDKKAPASLLSPKSKWIVVNPATGRVVSSPFNAVSSIPAGVVTDPANPVLAPAIEEARFLANLSDTVDIE
jgi:prepilin-type N-terminal cleavage/methylation domain-containing protein